MLRVFPPEIVQKLDYGNFLEELLDQAIRGYKRARVVYACDARVFHLYYKKDKFILPAYNAATVILADGRPIFWLSKLWLNKSYDQLTGPAFMMKVLNHDELKGKRHMFYGGSELTIEKLRARCAQQGVNVVYAESPPFLDIAELDIQRVDSLIREYSPDFFWCGLGAPKQEHLIHQLDKEVDVVMAGVGLAFDYYAGSVEEAPATVSRIGLEWVWRYGQQPARIKRFISPFFFVLRILVIEMVTNRLSSIWIRRDKKVR